MPATEPFAEVGSRREGRELALSVLYEAEMAGLRPVDVASAQPLKLDPFPQSIVDGVELHQTEIDELLESFAKGWTVDRMPVIDRLVLRIGAYELAYTDVPQGVAISEAVELASQYSTEKSAPFVNGLLARIRDEVR